MLRSHVSLPPSPLRAIAARGPAGLSVFGQVQASKRTPSTQAGSVTDNGINAGAFDESRRRLLGPKPEGADDIRAARRQLDSATAAWSWRWWQQDMGARR